MKDPVTYLTGSATGLDVNLFAPDGDPWCRFRSGFRCINGERCINHNAVREIVSVLIWWPS